MNFRTGFHLLFALQTNRDKQLCGSRRTALLIHSPSRSHRVTSPILALAIPTLVQRYWSSTTLRGTTPAPQATTERCSLSPIRFSAARDSKAARLPVVPSTASSSDRLDAPPHSDLDGRIYTLKLYSDPSSFRRKVPRAPGFPLHACALSERLSSLRVWHRFYGFPQPLGGPNDSKAVFRFRATQALDALPRQARFRVAQPRFPVLRGIESKDGVTPSSARRSRTSAITRIRLQHTRHGW